MNSKRLLLWTVGVTLALGFSALLFYSCSGGGGDDGTSGGASSSPLALYLTDDMSLFTQVTATVDKVQILNTGSDARCDVLTTPTAIDIADLALVVHLVTVAECRAASYNRIHIEFEKGVQLTSAPTGSVPGTASSCSFVSYKDEGNRPNALVCNGTTCSLDITGAVNVLAEQSNKLALDFNLKDFDVASFGTPTACTVTMKVSPLHAADMDALGRPEEITGLISALSTTDGRFTLTRGNSSFNVLYSGITPSQQPGLDSLLRRAETEDLKVIVITSAIDFSTMAISASAIFVKVEGTVSGLDTGARTFTITYKGGSSLTVDYGAAVVHGTLENSAEAAVRLYGADAGHYLASTVDAGAAEMTIDN